MKPTGEQRNDREAARAHAAHARAAQSPAVQSPAVQSRATRPRVARRHGARSRVARSRASVVALAFFALFVGGRVAGSRAESPAAQSLAAAPSPVAARQGGADFSRFHHETPRHAALACASCHERRDNAATPRLPGHKACTDCHLPQFVSQNLPLCAICHTSLEGQDPPVKNFPGLRSFGVRFDHAQHDAGAARPADACAACHRPAARRPAALTIPAGLAAHQHCYSCHTPGSQSGGRDISSCGVCHAPAARYARTPVNRAAFAASFSHAAHSPRQSLRCGDCHQLRAGLAQRQQVTEPRVAQHFAPARAQACLTCHNDRRVIGGRAVFGDRDFDNCRRCHTRQNFRMGL